MLYWCLLKLMCFLFVSPFPQLSIFCIVTEKHGAWKKCSEDQCAINGLVLCFGFCGTLMVWKAHQGKDTIRTQLRTEGAPPEANSWFVKMSTINNLIWSASRIGGRFLLVLLVLPASVLRPGLSDPVGLGTLFLDQKEVATGTLNHRSCHPRQHCADSPRRPSLLSGNLGL